MDAQLIGFNQERDTRYSLFKTQEDVCSDNGLSVDNVLILHCFFPNNADRNNRLAMSPVSIFAEKSHFRGLFFNLLQFVRTNPDQAPIMWEKPEGGFDYEQYCIPDESTGGKARIQKAEAGADGARTYYY